MSVASNDYSHLSQPWRRRAEGPPSTLEAADVRSLRAVLDRGRADNVAKYQHSITSILGDSITIDTGVFGGDSAAGAGILEDLSLSSLPASTVATSVAESRGGGDYLACAGHRKLEDIGIARSFTYVSRSSRGADPEAPTARGHRRTGVRRGRVEKPDPPCSSKRGPEDVKTGGMPSRSSATVDGTHSVSKQRTAAAGKASANVNKKGGRARGEAHQKVDPPSKLEPRRAKGQGRDRNRATRNRGDGAAHKSKDYGSSSRAARRSGSAALSETPASSCGDRDKRHRNEPKVRGRGSAATAETFSSASEASGPAFRYRVGETRVIPSHSAPLPAPEVAAALLAGLPRGSPLFVRRSDRRFTFAVLAGREGGQDGDGEGIVVALDAAGKQKKILEPRHWETCLRLVNARQVGDERRRLGGTAACA